MDVSTLAVAALSVLSPLLQKGGEEVSKSVCRDLWEKLKNSFSSDKEIKVIDDYEANPGERNAGKLEVLLQDKLETDFQLRDFISSELQKIAENKATNFTFTTNQTHHGSGDNVAGDKIVGR